MKYAFFLFLCLSISWYSARGQSKVVDSLQRIVALHRGDSTEVNALLDLVNELTRKDITKAKYYLYTAHELARRTGYALDQARVYHWLVVLNQQTGHLDSARYYLGRFEQLWKSNEGNGRVRANYVMAAGLFYKNQGLNKEALPFMLESVRLSRVYSNKTSQAGQLLNVGNLYMIMGDMKSAVTYHLQSLKLFEEVGNARGQSFALQSLGNDYSELNQHQSAKSYFERSLAMKQQLNDKRGIINAHLGLGETYRELKDFKTSERYLKEGRDAAREMKLVLEEARLEYTLGLLYKDINNREEAQRVLQHSIALARQGGDSALVAEIKGFVAFLERKPLRETDEERTLQGTLLATESSGRKGSVVAAYYNLAEYYANHEQFEKAYRNLKKYEQMNDSMRGNEVLLQIKQLETQYETDKKEQEIALLKKEQQLNEAELKIQKNRQLLIGMALLSVIVISVLLVNRYRVVNQARRQLEMEKIRTTIAQDLHDDIGSTLSSINIISKLALQQKDQASDHFQRINEQSSRMMESISDIVWSINPNNDSLEQMVMKMKEFASEILEPKEMLYSFQGEENLHSLSLDLSRRKNLFLIFKEAVNNAAKYSEAKEIRICFEKNGDQLKVTISDDGKGFDPHAVKSGNGQRNLRERAAAAGGVLQVDAAPGKGTVVLLSLPLT